jgi:hypothetical protein
MLAIRRGETGDFGLSGLLRMTTRWEAQAGLSTLDASKVTVTDTAPQELASRNLRSAMNDPVFDKKASVGHFSTSCILAGGE